MHRHKPSLSILTTHEQERGATSRLRQITNKMTTVPRKDNHCMHAQMFPTGWLLLCELFGTTQVVTQDCSCLPVAYTSGKKIRTVV
jgi:hypothetical protein